MTTIYAIWGRVEVIHPPSDHLGSTAITVSGVTETGDVKYYPFGTDHFTSGSTPTSFKYTGQR